MTSHPSGSHPIKAAIRPGAVWLVLFSARLRRAEAGGALVTVVLATAAMVLSYRWSEREGMDQLFDQTSERLELYAGSLGSELRRVDTLPALVALDVDVNSLLDDAGPAARERASRKLARLNGRVGAQLISVVDDDGHLLAASQGGLPEERLAGIVRALRVQGQGFFAALDGTGGTDYFRVQAISGRGGTQGWIVVRINLAPLEATWVDLGVRSQSERLLVLDEQDVVIMSSVPDWKYRTRNDVAAHWQDTLQRSGRYPPRALPSLNMRMLPGNAAAARLAELTGVAQAGVYVEQERALAPLGLRFMALSDRGDVLRAARSAAWGAGALVALVGVVLIYLLNRQRVLRQLFRARNELQVARDDLDQQVQLRTAELLGANAELERQIHQRRQSEDELIQAGKMAVLGQMSAGIAHELNQPLTALRALAGNTLHLLEAGRHDALQGNLRSIGDVAERMSRITSQLKTFARRWSGGPEEVALAAAVENTRLLLEHRLAAEGVRCQVDVPAGLRVHADSTRLEQVLLNLMTNALDAMVGCPEPRLSITAELRDGRAQVRISDSGAGMDEATLARLFEPFFTTKPAGEGLGLGLVISQKIVQEFGGTLQARRGSVGMVFEFDLSLAEGGAADV